MAVSHFYVGRRQSTDAGVRATADRSRDDEDDLTAPKEKSDDDFFYSDKDDE